MAGKRTIKQQLFNAVDSRFKAGKGRSKHQDRKNGDSKHDIVYSHSEMERLKDVAGNFSKFIKEKHPEIWRSQLSRMPVEIVNEYLDTKTDCTQNTINSYIDSIKKIFRCAGATYKTGDFSEMQYISKPISERAEEATLRDMALGRDLHDEILKKLTPGTGGYKGNLLNGILGTRSKETVHIRAKDIDLKKGTVYIHKGKGGKTRTLKLSKKQIELIKVKIFDKEDFKPNQMICGCGEDGIQKALTRALERVDKERGTNFAEQLKDKKTNQHAGRKMVATEQYNKNVNNGKYQLIYRKLIKEHREGKINLSGLNKYEIGARAKYILENYEHKYINKIELLEIEDRAWSKVSVFLGHGENRPELKKVYVITDNTKILSFT